MVFTSFGAFSQLSCHINVDKWGEPDYYTPFIYKVDYDNTNDIIAPVPSNCHFWVQTSQSGGYITVTHTVLPLQNGTGPVWEVWLSPNYITVRFEKGAAGILNFDFKWYKRIVITEAEDALQECDEY